MAQVTATVKKEVKPNLRYQRDKDRELVSGIFDYKELRGGTLKFRVKLYKEDNLERFELTDGKVYKIPLGVAKHLRKNGVIPQHAWMTDENGTPTQRITHHIKRFDFVSTDFLDLVEPEISPIATVETQIIKPF